MVSVSIQGAAGSFSEAAAKTALKPKRPNFVHCTTCAEAVELVHDGKADQAVLAVEDTNGPIDDGHLAAVSSGLKKGKSHWAPTEICLAAIPGTRVDDVTQIYGHQATLDACSDYIAMHGWLVNPWRDSAEAAREIKQQGTDVYAALCSAEAAALHGLEVLREAVQDRDDYQIKYTTYTPYASSQGGKRAAVAAPF